MLGVVLPAQGASPPVIALLFNYRTFSFSCIVSFASPERPRRGGMVGRLNLYYAGSRSIIRRRSITMRRNHGRRREWRARGSAAAGPESSSPLTNGGGGPQPPDVGEEIADPEGRDVGDPAARTSGGGLPRSAKDLEEDARFGLASRADPTSTDI